MATPLDLSLFSYFGVVFPFLLVVAVVYGFLSYMKPFGDMKAVYGLIAVTLGITMTISTIARETINLMAPWFLILFFLLIFMLIAIRLFGVSEGAIAAYVTKSGAPILWVVALSLIIGFGSLTAAISQEGGIGVTSDNSSQVISEGVTGESSQQNQFWATLVNPKVLGFALIMLIAVFTISRVTYVKA